MTTKDLRDIAAYWGAPFTGQILYMPIEVWASSFSATVNGSVIRALEEFGSNTFKLHLRSIASLTDEELVQCMEILQPEGSAFMRTGSQIQLGNYILNVDTAEVFDRHYHSVPTAKLYAYLQSIGVYVPGSINPEYVELQP